MKTQPSPRIVAVEDNSISITEEEFMITLNDLKTQVDVTVNLLTDENGEPGDLIEDNLIPIGSQFFVQIVVVSDHPQGLSTFSANLDFDENLLEVNREQFNDPASIITEKFNFGPARVAELSDNGIILSGGTLFLDRVIGANGNAEEFALLEFTAVGDTDQGALQLTVPGLNANSNSLGATLGDATSLMSENVTLNVENPVFAIETDNFPIIEPNQSFSVAENSPNGTFIGTVSARNLEGDAFSFSFDPENFPTDVDGDGNLPFAIDAEGNITVNDSEDLDLETEPSFRFGVSATEEQGDFLTLTATVTVNVNNLLLDVDNNSSANGSVDGLNILRVLFNPNPETMDVSQTGLTQQQVFDNIMQRRLGTNPLLDVDNNGSVNGSIDGLNILRVLFNLNPETMDVSQTDLTQQQVFNNIEELLV